MFSNKSKPVTVCTHGLTRLFAKRGGCIRAAICPSQVIKKILIS